MLIEDDAFWNEHVNIPCILVKAKVSAQTQIVREVPGPSRDQTPAPPAPTSAPTGSDLSRRGPDGRYTHNRKGFKLCDGFKAGTCTTKHPGGRCPSNSNEVHQCGICLQQHCDIDHGKNKPKAKAKGKGGRRR